jgi:cytoskeletal protein CcmA (bactofilin family)
MNLTHRSILIRSGLAVLLALVVLVGGTSTVKAADFSHAGTVAAGQTVDDDLFLGGDSVSMDGTVNGMLVAGGNTITINGTVNGDAFLAGSHIVLGPEAVINGNLFVGGYNIEIEGTVTGSLATGGTSLRLDNSAKIGRNAYFAGYSFEAQNSSTITTDLFGAGYQFILSGTVNRDASLNAGAIQLNGNIGRNAKFDVGQPGSSYDFANWNNMPGMAAAHPAIATGLHIAESATIGGKLVYTSPANQNSSIQGHLSSTPVYQTPVPQENNNQRTSFNGRVEHGFSSLGLSWAFGVLRNLITLVILGMLGMWLLPKTFRTLADHIVARPWPAAGYGLVVLLVGFASPFVVFPIFILIGILVSLLSLGGLVLTWFFLLGTVIVLAYLAFFFLVFTGSVLVTAYLIGNLLLRKIFPQATISRFWDMLVGVVLFVLVTAIPCIGWLAGLAAALFGLGAFWMGFRGMKSPAAPIAPVAPVV